MQSLWIHNIAIMTGLVTSTTTPPLLKLAASWRLNVDKPATYHLRLGDMPDAWRGFRPVSGEDEPSVRPGIMRVALAHQQSRPGLNGRR